MRFAKEQGASPNEVKPTRASRSVRGAVYVQALEDHVTKEGKERLLCQRVNETEEKNVICNDKDERKKRERREGQKER